MYNITPNMIAIINSELVNALRQIFGGTNSHNSSLIINIKLVNIINNELKNLTHLIRK
jgi:hypothetical protein